MPLGGGFGIGQPALVLEHNRQIIESLSNIRVLISQELFPKVSASRYITSASLGFPCSSRTMAKPLSDVATLGCSLPRSFLRMASASRSMVSLEPSCLQRGAFGRDSGLTWPRPVFVAQQLFLNGHDLAEPRFRLLQFTLQPKHLCQVFQRVADVGCSFPNSFLRIASADDPGFQPPAVCLDS